MINIFTESIPGLITGQVARKVGSLQSSHTLIVSLISVEILYDDNDIKEGEAEKAEELDGIILHMSRLSGVRGNFIKNTTGENR